jgi:competence protein ComEC
VRHPTLLPALVILAGLVVARLLPAPAGVVLCVPLLGVYAGAVCAFVRRHRAFLVLVLVDIACAAWLLASAGNRTAVHPSLLDAFDVVRSPKSEVRFPAASVGAELARPAPQTPAPSPQPADPVILEGILRQDASSTPFGASLSLDVRAIRLKRQTVAVSGGVIASVSGALAATRLENWRAGRVVRAPVLLREPTTFANPGLRDERLALARRGVHLFASIKSGALVEVVRAGGWWAERVADIRAFARRAISRSVGRWSEQSAGIVIAILIGDRAGLTSEVERRLQDAGTYHVIAISGGNIAILAGFLLGLCRLLEVRTRTAACGTILVLVAYADLVGGGASVVRATLMAVTYMIALAFDLRGSPMNALFAAACAILCATPLSLYDVAFALTFGATLGILVAGAALGAHLPRRVWLRAPAGLLLASASAELALLPVGASAFSRVTFAGLALNFFAIPLMAVAQLAGMFVLPLALVDARLAAAVGYFAHLGAAGLVSTASLVDLVPALVWRVPAPGAGVIALYYAAFPAWFAAAHAMRLRSPRLARTLRGAAIALLVTSAAWILWSPLARLRGSRPTGLLRMTVVDVGQADAILVRFPDARTMLVDAGGSRTGGSFDVGMRVIAPVLWHHDVFRLDRFVLSHGDPDHIGGAVALVRAFPIGETWEGIDVPRDLALQEVHREAAARRIPGRPLRAGERLEFGGTQIAIWHPPPPDWERQKIRNDDSIVMAITFGQVSLLLTGDIGMDVERPLARRITVAPLCVMKVPHHGSGASSSAAFLAAVRPALAIFTVGSAAIGTPALDAVTARYTALGAVALRTGEEGAVEVETDGREVRVVTFAGRRCVFRAPPS